MNTLIVILGPTGIGKTKVAIEVAEHFNIPIINADSRQIFAEIPIGTAAPTKEQQSRVKHFSWVITTFQITIVLQCSKQT